MFKELKEYYQTIDSLSKHTIRSYKFAIDLFIVYFDIESLQDVRDITTGEIQSWLAHLAKDSDSKNKRTARNSANARFRVIKAFYGWLTEVGYLEQSPCNSVRPFKKEKIIKVYLTTEEQSKMLLACDNIKSRLMVALALYTGLRRSELVNIEIDDLQIHNEEMFLLVHGKGKKERRVLLIDYVRNLIENYLDTRSDDCPYLFVTARAGFSDRYESGDIHPISAEAFRKIVKGAAERAGIDEKKLDKIAPHTLRRSFAVNLIKEYGASSFQVQKALGHSSIRTTELYLDAAGSEIADDVVRRQLAPTGA